MKHPEGDFPTPASENAEGVTESAPVASEWAAPQVPSEWEAPGSFSAPAVTPVQEFGSDSVESADETTFRAENGHFDAAESDSPENSDVTAADNEAEIAQDGSQQASWSDETAQEPASAEPRDHENAGTEGSVDPDSSESPVAEEVSVHTPYGDDVPASASTEPASIESANIESANIESAEEADDEPAVEPAVESPDANGESADAEVTAGTASISDHSEAGDAASGDAVFDDSEADDSTAGNSTAGDEASSVEVDAPAHESTVAETLAAAHAPAAEPIAASALDDTPLARELAEITRRRQALNAQSLPLPDAPRIFTVANQKGGVGKTTTTVNLAAALARGGARVLVIDLDPQGNASTALGVEHRADTVSVYDVIINDEPMAEVVQKSPEFAGLYCVPATIHLAGAEIELVSLVAREQRLRTSLDLFLSEAEEPFHYVFIDCPPSLGLLTINAFVAAREVLIPIQCEYYALEGLSQLLSNIQLIERHLNPRLTVSTILLTMYDGRTNLANQVADDVREHFPREVLDTLIPRSVRISEAPSYGQSVISYDPSSPGSLSYLEAAAEIAKRGAPA